MDFLRKVGSHQCEGIVLWVGTLNEPQFVVQHAVVPRQRAFSAHGGVCVIADDDSLADLNQWLYQSGERLIAQVHSHPLDAYHSEADDANAIITTVGGLSIVVPDFAKHDFTIENVAAYRLAKSGWKPLTCDDLATLLRLE